MADELMDFTEILNKNPVYLLALFSIVAFPMGLLLLGYTARKMGIGNLVKVLSDHIAVQVKIETKLTEILTELKNQNAANWDNRRYLDEQFDFLRDRLHSILTQMPKRKED